MIFAAEEVSPVVSLGLGALMIGAGALLWVMAVRTAGGRTGRNNFIGIRTKATQASDGAWLAAHKAAERSFQVAAVECVLTGLALMVLGQNSEWMILIVLVGVALMLGAVVNAFVLGTQAAGEFTGEDATHS